jgi:TonB family protein
VPVNAVATSAPPSAAPAPAAPKVQVGELVQSGPGVIAPKMSGMPEPRYPAAARRMNKSADVQIRVLVDELGRVVQTEPASGKVGFGFDEAAMEAARRSSYRPATKDGVRVKMWTVMRVSFRP